MSFAPPITKIRHRTLKIVRGPKLPLALTAAVLVSLVLTGVSVAWYMMDGSSKLDLSRPGFERERTEVRATDTQKSYDTSSPITKSAIDDFLKEYDDRSKELSGYGNFSDGTLDDSNIQLVAPSGKGSATQ
jgi:hypothetical protein